MIFEQPSGLPALSESQVHVWHLALDSYDAPEDSCSAVLSDDERERSGRFMLDGDRLRFVYGRGNLRKLLGSYIGIDPASVSFTYNEYGKPSADGMMFNLSHSGGHILYAFSRTTPVGIDIERIRPDVNIDRIAGRFFDSGEAAELAEIGDDQRVDAFYNCWTRKEAFAKAHGAGLFMGLSKFRVSLAPGDPAQLISVGDIRSTEDRDAWSIADIEMGPGFKAALAVGTETPNIHFYSL